MQIGEVIRKYRKNKNMTQEDMAKRLGVTAPAVNKWERGNSLPDIMLLAPIARLLDISLDTLLSFREDLTDEEVNNLIIEADSKFKNETFEDVFLWAKKKMEMYPNCEHLTLWMAHLLNARCRVMGVSNPEKYEDYISSCYVRLLDSIDEDTRSSAADSLFGFYLRKEQYEKAEEYLIYFSKQNPERKRKQAIIYSKTNRRLEAYKSYEELLFSGYQVMSVVLYSIFALAMEDKNMEKAHVLADKQLRLANLLEMGEYEALSFRLELAVAEKDIKLTIDTMEKMLVSTDEMCPYTKSPLYEHMVFKELTEEFLVGIKEKLLAYFRDEDTFDYLQSDKRWKEIVEKAIPAKE